MKSVEMIGVPSGDVSEEQYKDIVGTEYYNRELKFRTTRSEPWRIYFSDLLRSAGIPYSDQEEEIKIRLTEEKD